MRESVKLFHGSSGNERVDPVGLLKRVGGLRYSTQYPGGLAGACTFMIHGAAPRAAWPGNINDRVKIFDGLFQTWDGKLIDIIPGPGGIMFQAIGHWGDLLQKRYWHKRFADQRIDEKTWQLLPSGGGNAMEMCTFDRFNRLMIVPKAVAFANGDNAGFVYTAPPGQTIARIEFTYDFAEAAQNWALELRDITNASTPISITATGTASTSHNFSPVSSQIQLRLRSLAAQTPAADGTIYAEFTSITVYAEWEGATPTVAEGTLNLTQLGYDTIDKLSGEISADAWGIGANSQSIIPFVSDPALFISDVLINAAGYGDASQNRWAVLLREGAIASDDLPLLVAEQYPALTGYDWIVNYEGPGLSDIGLSYSLADVFNWIRVEYTDSLGVTTAITPDTDSSLTDATSVTQWGQREYTLRINHGGQTAAVAAGKRFLASHKDPKWLLASGLQLSGRVKDDIGVSWPVNRVRAGQRIKVGNFFDDGSGTYLNFLITSTDYDAESESMTVEVGVPAIMLASAVLKFESTVLGIQ